ncbi:helix-turn-helix transcriptional regulator [Nocardia ninae]|uniref:helix-turn-helix transcriptional regulator n=1 Tax=Nocardia ninae TaxID=356145 RepID=UPI0011BEDB5B|nr:helix-turn-helix domain-containing protein [Nocardia ninae]
MSQNTEWLTRAEVSARLKVSVQTLANWAWEGRGPRFARPGGGHCRYRLTDVMAWEDEQFGG